MKPAASILPRLLARGLLLTASVLVPRRQRAEWLAEWRGELWHVQAEATSNQQAIGFAAGAFQDAACLRREREHSYAFLRIPRGSATRCVAVWAVFAAAGFLICLWLPGTRRSVLPSKSSTTGLVMISGQGYAGLRFPTVHLVDYRAWTTNSQHLYTELAFYQPVVKSFHVDRHHVQALSIARASGNLIDFLNLPFSTKQAFHDRNAALPQLFLSQRTWRSAFGSDANIFGRIVVVGGQTVSIAGILPDNVWPLASRIDAWLFEDTAELNSLAGHSKGFVIARVQESGIAASYGDWWFINVPRPGGAVDHFDCIAVSRILNQPKVVFLFTLILAVLSLPATTPLPLGEYPGDGERRGSGGMRRWVFLASKLMFILPAVYFWSIAIAYNAESIVSSAPVYIQLLTSFIGLLCAFRWAWKDQRRRCPVCLQLLSSPARVGQASHNFLSWSGTEWICVKGHGLLHIPELPTSWLSTQRWLNLDPSWSSLFTGAYARSSESM